ncbi:MAG: HAD family phosphatase [Deltaproteobacteria bacterium]|nr:HAD family phosphatase [Deltaproteobacteria bacterium]
MPPHQRPPLDALAFDLGNVLIRVDHLRFCRRLGALAGLAPEMVYTEIFVAGREPDYDAGRLSTGEFHYWLVQRFGVALPFSLFREWWVDLFDPMEGMEDLLARLRGRFPLYLISNTNALHFTDIYRRFPLLRHFRRFILSYQVGSRKPEPAIYQALIRETGVAPERCLFIDDRADFVAAAQEHGLTAWQFTTPGDLCARLSEAGVL